MLKISLRNAYLQSGKQATPQISSVAAINGATNGTANGSSTPTETPEIAPTPSGNSPPSLYKVSTSKAPTFRPSSPPQPTTSSSLTHAQGQHVPQTAEAKLDAHVPAADAAGAGVDGTPSYAEVAAE